MTQANAGEAAKRADMGKALTAQETDLIFQGLDELLRKDGTDHLMGSLLSAMLSPTKEAGIAALDREKKDYDAKADRRRVLNERVTLLKAKLIQLRDSATADRVMADAALAQAVTP